MDESRDRTVGGVITAVIDAVPESVLLLDRGGTIVLVNRELESLFGYPRGELVGRSVEMLLPPRLRALQRRDRGLLTAQRDEGSTGVSIALFGLRKDGTEFPMQVSLSAIETPGDVLAMGAVLDVSEHMDTERRLLEVERDLSVLEDDKRRADDVHGEVIEHLFAAGLSLGALLRRASNPVLQGALAQAVSDIDASILALRTAAFDSACASKGSIKAQVFDICAEMLPALGNVPSICFVGPLERTEPVVRDTLLAVLREALLNVARHAGATRVAVTLSLAEGLMLTVEDDGVGLGDAIRQATGRGLANMRARAHRVGGTFEVGSNKGSGTRLEWWAPAS